MTWASMALMELAEKGADLDMLREMLEFATQRLMEFGVENRCGAPYGARGVPRVNSRDGYRDRTWETRAGSIDLKIPKLRQGSYFPSFLEPRTNVVGIFPNDPAIIRLVGALLLEQNDEWQLQRRYMKLDGLQTVSDNTLHRISAVVTG